MDAHTTKERRLKRDIIHKNIVRKDLHGKTTAIKNWTEKLAESKKQQRLKRIEKSIIRYQEEIEPLKQ